LKNKAPEVLKIDNCINTRENFSKKKKKKKKKKQSLTPLVLKLRGWLKET
jgi:hypothetical protein